MLIIALLWGLSGIQSALAQASSSVRLSKNADFSTEDRQFNPSDRLYILVTAPNIDYTHLDKNEFELKSAGNGPDLEGTLTNNLDGSYEAQIPLQFTDGNGADWEVRIRLEDEGEHEFIREISITIIEDNNEGEDDASDDTGDENAEEDASGDDSGDGNADEDDASGGDGAADDGTSDDADTDDGTGNDDRAEDDASTEDSGDDNTEDDNAEDDAGSDDAASEPENTGRPGLAPPQFHLYQNYPNPFHQQTTILFDIFEESPQHVRLIVYDALGREIKRLVDAMLGIGKHEAPFNLNGSNTSALPNGTYFYRLEINGFTQTRSFSIAR